MWPNHRGIRRVAWAAILTGTAAWVGGCAATGGAGGAGATTQEDDRVPGQAFPGLSAAKVKIDNFAFVPRELTVARGATVTWVNADDVPHTATATQKPREFDTGTLDTDDTASHVFKTAGTFDYFCAVHPHMTGRVIVR